MKKKSRFAGVVVGMLILIALAYGLTQASISSLPAPGSLETGIATSIRDWLIARAARTVPQPGLPDNAATVSKGKTLYGMVCASCHGQDARGPTPIGKSMYPRVPNLGSPRVQSLSDQELFWVVKNGIRLSGMPGFARINTDNQIWQLVYYVRSIGKPAKK